MHEFQRIVAGVGDVVKQMHSYGCSVQFKQLPIHELEFHVEDLTCDLADGVILCRLAECIYQDNRISLIQVSFLPNFRLIRLAIETPYFWNCADEIQRKTCS